MHITFQVMHMTQTVCISTEPGEITTNSTSSSTDVELLAKIPIMRIIENRQL